LDQMPGSTDPELWNARFMALVKVLKEADPPPSVEILLLRRLGSLDDERDVSKYAGPMRLALRVTSVAENVLVQDMRALFRLRQRIDEAEKRRRAGEQVILGGGTREKFREAEGELQQALDSYRSILQDARYLHAAYEIEEKAL